jgi:hypothetical protein
MLYNIIYKMHPLIYDYNYGHPNLIRIHSYKNFDDISTMFILNDLTSTHLVA